MVLTSFEDGTSAPSRAAKEVPVSRKWIVRGIAQWLLAPRRLPDIRDAHIRRDIGLDQ